MSRFSAEIDFSELVERLDRVHQQLTKFETLLLSRAAKDSADAKPIPQKAAMKDLEVSFPTFKKLCTEFRVKPIKRNGRLFYKPADIIRILNGQK